MFDLRHVWGLVAAVALGCGGGGGSKADDGDGSADEGMSSADAGDDDDGGAETGAPNPDDRGPATVPLGRRIHRLTADQYMRSLEVATGQTWPDYDAFAAALGKADFSEITDEGRDLSVTFDKFVHDAALFTCRAAIDADVTTGSDAILKLASVDDGSEAKTRANLRYLYLRFFGVDLPADHERLQPWVDLMTAPTAGGAITSEIRRERWVAVCVGLATHTDFVTY